MKQSAREVRDPNALPFRRGATVELKPRHRDLDDLSTARKWVSSLPRPWAVDLFCGAGGLSLGLQRAGLKVVAAADSDPWALATHAANVGGLCWSHSLASPAPFLEFLAERKVRQVEVVAGGPPCQPFSRAAVAKIRSLVREGKRSPEDERAALWQSYRKVLAALKPKVALLENVPDMISWEDGQAVLGVLEMFRELGYVPEVRVLRGEDYGVPQHRSRLFIVARTVGSFTWPRRRARVTVWDAIGDLPAIPPGHREESCPYDGPETAFQRQARAKVSQADQGVVRDHCTRDVRADDAKAFALLDQGQTYADLPARYQRYRTDIFDDKYKRLAWASVSRTITAHIAKDGYWYIHPDQDRTLSIREAARLQTFPDHIRFAGPPTQQLRQIGNAVPPALAYAVGRRLVACLDSKEAAREPDVAGALIEWAEKVPPKRSARAWPYLAALVCAGPRDRHKRWQAESAIEAELASPLEVSRRPGHVEQVLSHLDLSQRATDVETLAAAIIERHAGRVPVNQNEIRALPHVSGLMAAMVCSEVYELPLVVLDAPRRRVVQRLSGRADGDIWELRLEALRLAGEEGPSPAYNRALRALADGPCHPGRPTCDDCPVLHQCASAPA